MIGVSLAVFAASTVANADETPPLIADMDRYIEDPRGAGTYRALAGLGDPYFGNPVASDGESWEQQEADRKLFDLDYGGNCRPAYALKTYRERASRLGENHPYVAQWLKVQRGVFSVCKGWNPKERQFQPLPVPLALGDPELDRLQRADRAYQAASQLFYLGKIGDARLAFSAIGAQRGPHQSAAMFMVAAIDAGSRPDVEYPPPKAKPGAVAQAKGLLTNPKTSAMRADAHELIGWLGASADTRETRVAQVGVTLEALHFPLAKIRSDPQAAARYRRSVEDLPALWTKFENLDWWLNGAVPQGYYGSLAMAQAAKRDRLAAFQLMPLPCRPGSCPPQTLAFDEYIDARLKDADKYGDRDVWRVISAELRSTYEQPDFRVEIDRLIARVQQSPTDHDVALLMLLADQQLHADFEGNFRFDEGDKRADRLRAAALMEHWPWPQSQWFTKRYAQSLRVLTAGGYIGEARALRDRVGPRVTEQDYWSDPGVLVMLLAEDRDHFIEAMVRYKKTDSPLIDRLPIVELKALAQDSRIPAGDRARFARVAWTRSYLIDKRIPKDLDQLMRSLNPELAAGWHSKIGARTADHQLLLDVLHSPEMNLRAASRSASGVSGYGTESWKPGEIDIYQHSLNNWWCGPVAVDFAEREESALSDALGEGASRSLAERLLAQSWVWQALDRRERAALAQHSMAPRMLAEAAVAWGEKANSRHPDGADEALALAVRSTRYGCQFQGGHGPWSKAAWDVLHQRFPDSDAAKRTRWWFDCKHFTYGCSDSTKDDQIYVPDEPDPEPIKPKDADKNAISLDALVAGERRR
jgi:hypothetical protein